MRASSPWIPGLLGLAAVLCAVLGAIALAALHEQRAGQARVAVTGPALTALIAARVSAGGADAAASAGALEILRPLLAAGPLAYVSVEQDGSTLAALSAPGVQPPPPAASRADRRELVSPSGPLREYLVASGAPARVVRTGWRLPAATVQVVPVPLLAAIVAPLAVLALAGLALARRAGAPRQRMHERLTVAASRLGMPPRQPGDMVALATALDGVLGAAEERLQMLGEDAEDRFAENRLFAYQKRSAEAALDALPDGLVIMDEAGVASFANARVESLIGVAAAAITGHKPHEWCAHAEVVALLSRYYSNVTRLRRSDHLEFSPAAAGERRVSVSARPLAGAGTGGATLIVFRDVTTEALARKSRDDFVGHVAHELKSPLNVIRMHAEMLGDFGAGLPAQTVQSLTVIEDEVDRLARLVNDLLNLTRLESGSLVIERQRVKLNGFLEDVFETTRRAAGARGLTTSLDVPPRLGSIALDKDLFRIALNNLLTNAVKYNRDGGNVTLRAEETDAAFVIQVVDTGLGIAPAESARIFEKFYRASDEAAAERGGHGLGLALAREIVALHNGRISVDSVPGEGSTFTIELRKSAHLLQEAS
ncbi:MAG: ATP-binding protein [Gammaproteobacteria bacterium]